MSDGLNAWEKETIKENSLAIRSIETDVAIAQKDIVTNKEDVKRIEERLIEHKVKSETTTEQVMLDVNTLKESFSGFRGEIKGSLNSLKFFIPLAMAAISGVVGIVTWILTVTGNGTAS